MKEDKPDILHHTSPPSFGGNFNLLIVFDKVDLPFILGPVVTNDLGDRSNRGIRSTSKAIIWLIANFKLVWKKLNNGEVLPRIMLKISALEKLHERSRVVHKRVL